MKISQRGQAALEFLTTYAWAFVIILVVIAAIAYFGILNPSKLLPDRCNFAAGFDCQAFKIGSADTFDLRLKNSVGKLITVTSMALSTESTVAFSCTTAPANPTNWKTGDIIDLSWSLCNSAAVGFVSGDKGKVFVEITYYDVKAGATYTQIAKGEVFATIT